VGQVEGPPPHAEQPQLPATLCEHRPQPPAGLNEQHPQLPAALSQEQPAQTPKEDDDDDDGLIIKLADRLITLVQPILENGDWRAYLMLMGVLGLIGLVVVLVLVL
jgi:hypothetical protein